MSDLIQRAEQVKGLAGDSSLPKSKRFQEGVQAFSGLVLTEIPDDVRERFEADLAGVNEVLARYELEYDEDSQIASGLVAELSSFAPQEVLETITEAYDRDLVDLGLIGLESVQRSIAEGKAGIRSSLDRCGPTGIEDTIVELRLWDAFQEK